jgi:hypothetical protein
MRRFYIIKVFNVTKFNFLCSKDKIVIVAPFIHFITSIYYDLIKLTIAKYIKRSLFNSKYVKILIEVHVDEKIKPYLEIKLTGNFLN